LFQTLVKKWQPKALQAYPSVLSILCDLLKPGEVHIPIIFLGSENLYDWQREKFQRCFPNSVLQCWYGHAEKAAFAPWVPGTTIYEPNPFYGYTELIKDNGEPAQPGEEGEIVATGFFALATPFLRYRTGDRALRSKEPVMKSIYNTALHYDRVLGRVQEVIVTRSGRYISMTSQSMHGGLFRPFREFQFYQDTPGRVILNFVPISSRLNDKQIQDIARTLEKKISDGDLSVELQQVDSIPRTVSGKWRYLDQRLNIKYHEV
jgi:phenylacetate-CoA ligase